MVSCVAIFLALAVVDAGALHVSPQRHQTTPTVAYAAQQSANASSASSPSMKAAVAEFIAMTCFVIIGCGSAMALKDEPGWLLQVSLAFGLAITCLAYAIGHISGGQINCAVTLGLAIVGNITWVQAVINFAAQICGAVLGAIILLVIFGEEGDKTGGLGTNAVANKERLLPAMLGEIFGTFLLVFVVCETAVSPDTEANRVNAPLAIGIAVFLAHCMLIPIDGCSINPTRTFGPMLVRKLAYKNQQPLGDQWVFWAGPLIGATFAAALFLVLADPH